MNDGELKLGVQISKKKVTVVITAAFFFEKF